MKNNNLGRVLLLCLGGLGAFSVKAWDINLPNGRYRETVTDMQVKVLGGYVRLTREYGGPENTWKINPAWANLMIEGREHSIGCSGTGALQPIGDAAASYDICQIRRNEAEFQLDASGQALVLKDSSRYVLRPLWVPSATNKSLRNIAADSLTDLNKRVSGFRWEDRTAGDWIEYDLQGRIQRYGDRSNVGVTLQYNAAQQLTSVKDHHGNVVLSYDYDAENRLTVVTDLPAANDPMPQRSVRYSYADPGDGNPATPARKDIATVTDVRGHVTTYGYNGKQQLTTIKNAENETLTIAYGSAGKVSEVTEADGAKTNYDYSYDKLSKEFTARITYPATSAGREREERVYDADGKLIKTLIGGELRNKTMRESARLSISEDGLGQKTITETDALGNVIKTTYADSSFTTAKYSAVHGQVEEEVDELGVRTTYEYDAKGNLLKKIEAAGLPEQRTTEYGWDSLGQLLTQTVNGGAVPLPNGQSVTTPDATVTYTYDNQGNRATVTDAENHATGYTYNRLGQPVTITDARSKVWTKDYDVAGNLLGDANPLNQATTYVYDKLNRVKSQTDALTHTSGYQYDVRGKLTKTTNALSYVKEQQFDARGRLTKEIDELGKAQSIYTYGANGLPATVTDGNVNVTSYGYDTGLQLTAVQYPTYKESYEYDPRGRRLKTHQHLDATTVYINEIKYDAKGRAKQQIDRNSKLTQQQYDALGRLIAITDPALGVTRYTYDSRDNLLALTDANQHSTVFAYDRNNRTLSETRPEGQTQTYAYGPTGLLTLFTDAKGNCRQFDYDEAGRRIEERHFAAGAQSAVRTTTYHHNAVGSLIGWQDTNQAPGMVALSASYIPDELQRITQETVTYGAQSFTTQTAYYANGRRQQLIYPDGYVVQYGYEDGQQLSNMTLPDGTISYQQKLWNQPQRIQYPGGSTQQRSYDPLLRLTELVTQAPNQQERYRLRNVYDPESNITQQSGSADTVNYGYDDLYRLTSAAQPSPLQDEAYSYDPLGNRLTDSRRGGPQHWQYNGNNQLLQSFALTGDSITHRYDPNGSLTGRNSTVSEPGLNQQYGYDAANRLNEVRNAQNELVARYQYDPFDRRVGKMLFNAQGTNPATTWFVYGREGLLTEINADGSTKTAYGWKPDGVWGTDTQFMRTRPLSAAATDPLTTYYIQSDQLGTSQRIIDANGAVVWAKSAYAFGEIVGLSVEVIKNQLRFPGQYHDEETSTEYNYFRDYNPNTGRYVQTDPIGLKGGANYYLYVIANPILYSDYLGLGPLSSAVRGAGHSIMMPGSPVPGSAGSNGADLAGLINDGSAGACNLSQAGSRAQIQNYIDLLLQGTNHCKTAYWTIGYKRWPTGCNTDYALIGFSTVKSQGWPALASSSGLTGAIPGANPWVYERQSGRGKLDVECCKGDYK